jgi:hypothetical protein
MDKSNAEARSRLDRVMTILSDLEIAKRFMEGHDYSRAIEIFSQILEVKL